MAGANESHNAPVRPSVLPNDNHAMGVVYRHQGVEVRLDEQRSHDPQASSSSQPAPATTNNSVQDGVSEIIDNSGENNTEENEQIEGRQNGNRRMIKDVKYPSREEIEEHNKTHSPFQEWCRFCV